jgi:hypothetical protein
MSALPPGMLFGGMMFGAKEIGIYENERSDKSDFTRDPEFGVDDEDFTQFKNRTIILTILVGTIGLIASAVFIGFGISAEMKQQEAKFEIRAAEVAHEFAAAWEDYETASRWLHQACGAHPISRHEFRGIYEYLTTGLNVQVRTFTFFLKFLPIIIIF